MLFGGGRVVAVHGRGFVVVAVLAACSPACPDSGIGVSLRPERLEHVTSVSVQGPCTIKASCDAAVCEDYFVTATEPGKCLVRVEYSDGAPSYAASVRFGGSPDCCEGYYCTDHEPLHPP
jgi:hypothetical protein